MKRYFGDLMVIMRIEAAHRDAGHSSVGHLGAIWNRRRRKRSNAARAFFAAEFWLALFDSFTPRFGSRGVAI